MKFTKTAVAMAVAGCAAAPMMASAETTLSGVLEVQVSGVETDDDDLQQDAEFTAGDVRVAVGSEQELTSGLIGYGNIQLNLDNLTGEGGTSAATLGDLRQSLGLPPVDEEPGPGVPGTDTGTATSLNDRDEVIRGSSATVAADNIYVGIKGGFGDLRFGDIPLAVEYGQLANDIHDVGTTVPGGASYTGTFGPVGFGLNYSPQNDSDLYGVGINFALAGFNVGIGFEERADQQNVSAGVSFAIAGFSIAVAGWQKGVGNDTTVVADFTSDDPTQTLGDDGGTGTYDDITDIAVQVGYSIAGVSLGLTYSLLASEFNVADVADDDVDLAGDTNQDVIRLDVGYDLGGGLAVSTRIQNVATDLPDGFEQQDDRLEYRVQLAKVF